jgi:hypothetical protein
MMNITSNRNFGIEIECKGLTMEAALAAIQVVGVCCNIENYNHQVSSAWKIVTDASVSGGFEVVSPILSGNEGLAEVQKVSDALMNSGATVEKDCGFHVHVDARDLNGLTIANILTRYAKYETAIDAVMPKSRRENNNRFCASVVGLANRFQNLSMDVSSRSVAGMVSNRYYKLNLCSFVRHGTVEFRQHSGTVKARKMIPWIIFCVNFVETSKVAVVEEEVGGTDATVGLRKNAIEKKFAAMAKLLDEHTYRSNYVSTATLAAAMGVDESTVPNYISAFRKKYPAAEISARRGRGYYRDCSQSLLAMVGVTVSTVVHRVEMPVDTGMFMGLEQSTISYFQERAMDLAS